MTDAATLLSAYQRTASNSVTVRLESESSFDEFKTALTTNPTLSVSVERETDYYARQSTQATTFFSIISYVVGGIMALGALFGALNTMYSAVSARAVEIATLRAIGFGASGVVVSVLAESLVLALLGALLGAAISWALFSGNTIALGNGVSSLVFEMQVTPTLLAIGVGWACAVGFIGGLVPGRARGAAAGRDGAARDLARTRFGDTPAGALDSGPAAFAGVGFRALRRGQAGLRDASRLTA